jgi:hypothetical protein
MDEWDAVNYRDKSGKHGDKEFDKTGSKNRKKEKYVKDEKDKKSVPLQENFFVYYPYMCALHHHHF